MGEFLVLYWPKAGRKYVLSNLVIISDHPGTVWEIQSNKLFGTISLMISWQNKLFNIRGFLRFLKL